VKRAQKTALSGRNGQEDFITIDDIKIANWQKTA
jgi:hypothetical protein